MNVLRRAALGVFALVVLAGCASTTVTSREAYTGGKLARPNRIIVHDFAATPADIPAGSTRAARYVGSAPQSSEDIQLGRKLGAEVARELITNIQGMGLPAVAAAGQPAPRVGDLVIMGYFESVDAGSAVKRMVLGFGSGAAELRTEVEGYLMTETGLRRLGEGEVDSGTGKMPGLAAPAVIAAATGNPIGLIISTAAKAEGQISGRTTIDGAAKRTAKEISDQLRGAFQRQGWI